MHTKGGFLPVPSGGRKTGSKRGGGPRLARPEKGGTVRLGSTKGGRGKDSPKAFLSEEKKREETVRRCFAGRKDHAS